MSVQTCPKHGPYIAEHSTDFGETWCPECGPLPPGRFDLTDEEIAELPVLDLDLDRRDRR